VNKANEFVGIIFDGNIQSSVLDCIFADQQARAVSVDSRPSRTLRKFTTRPRWQMIRSRNNTHYTHETKHASSRRF